MVSCFSLPNIETKNFQKPNPTSNFCQEWIAKAIKIQEHQMIIPSARVCKRSCNPKNIKWFLVQKKLQKKLKSGKRSLNCKRSLINCTPPQHHDEEMLFYWSWSIYRYTKKIHIQKSWEFWFWLNIQTTNPGAKFVEACSRSLATSTLIWITKKKANWKTSPVLSTHMPRQRERERAREKNKLSVCEWMMTNIEFQFTDSSLKCNMNSAATNSWSLRVF